ncbi:MAG: hypothetical protein ACFFDF_08080 [Candidatus Odinarchaeota archaeon]
MTKSFNFDEYFDRYENNRKIQKQIEDIIKVRYPDCTFQWIEDKERQEKGLDLILWNGWAKLNIDIKGISYARNHHYLKDISVELVSNYDLWINTKGNQGQSWLFKITSETHAVLYYWLDKNGNVMSRLILIYYDDLRKWGSYYFPFNDLFNFLRQIAINKKIKTQSKKSQYLGKIDGFALHSARNLNKTVNSFYYTINTGVQLKEVADFFKESQLEKIVMLGVDEEFMR